MHTSSLIVLLWFGLSGPGSSIDPGAATPPAAKKIPKTTAIHGETLIDDYFWLREKANPAVIAHLEAENAYTAARHQARLEPIGRPALYAEMRGRIKEADLDVPYRLGDFFYYTRTEQGKQYPIYARKRGSLDAPEEVLLDLNELAKGERSSSRSGPWSATTATCWPISSTSPASGSTPSGSRTSGPASCCPTGSRRSTRRSGRPTAGRSSTSPRTPPSDPFA